MTSELMLISPGALATIQDQGRFGYRRFGVPQSGVLHPGLAHIANSLAGNNDNGAVIEFFLSGPSFRLEKGIVRLALAGDFTVELTRGRAKRSLQSWRTVTLKAGDTLQLGSVLHGKVGYVAVAGGFDLPRIMNSRSTYMRGGFGGIGGDRLHANTRLPLARGDFDQNCEQLLKDPPNPEDLGLMAVSEESEAATVRVILGPQEDYFTAEARDQFLSGVYTVSRESDRMGSRLQGPTLVHHPDKKPEIISDGIVPGAIQVPGNGAPIVLLMDGPTAGGYPKIATVITADLPKLAVMPPGGRIRFEAVTPEAAEQLLRQQQEELQSLLGKIEPWALEHGVNLEQMYSSDLVSGTYDAMQAAD